MKLADTRNLADVQRLAAKRLPRPILDYLEGGADDEVSLRRNTTAFDDYSLIPRALTDVSSVDTGTQLLGRKIEVPFILSPTGSSRLFHIEGELAVARAAAQAGTMYALSTMATTALEDVAAIGDQPQIFQLYVFKDRGFTAELVQRCKAAGYHALCLTVDAAIGGNRERDLLSGMTMPPSLSLRSFLSFATHPSWSLSAMRKLNFGFPNFATDGRISSGGLSAAELFNNYFDASVTWQDAEWLAKIWGGPLLIKGLLSVEDVRRAAAIGAAGVMVSNHGGRQLDGTPAPIDRIAELRDAVDDALEIILDGGVRRGTHVLKALAAGANACAIGRPYLYGLAAGGEQGVNRVLTLLKEEIERSMVLLGTSSVQEIRTGNLVRPRR